jgi:outer membrane protein
MKTKVILTLALILGSVFSYAQKFAYVDTDYILENISEYRLAQDQLDELATEWQQEIEDIFAEVDKMYKAYQAEALLLPEDVRRKRENEIIVKEKEAKELQKKRFGKDGDLFKKRQELVKPIQDKVYAAIEEISNEGGYAIIFDKASSTTLLYTNPKFDKSDDVLEKLGYKAGAIEIGE